MTIPAYPLQWPTGWKRTRGLDRTRAKFGKQKREYGARASDGSQSSWLRKGEVSIAEGVDRVRAELSRMGISDDDLVISTNLALRLDGFPKSGQREPDDPGVAVYWTDRFDRSQPPRCMAIDRYDRVADNLAAIAATLDAMRAIDRHGGAEVLNRAFVGFLALPPSTSTTPWRDVLGFLPSDTLTSREVEARFKECIKGKHPDQGGDPEQFAQFLAARDAARLELCYEMDQSDWGK
jgi:hypothetical protein